MALLTSLKHQRQAYQMLEHPLCRAMSATPAPELARLSKQLVMDIRTLSIDNYAEFLNLMRLFQTNKVSVFDVLPKLANLLRDEPKVLWTLTYFVPEHAQSFWYMLLLDRCNLAELKSAIQASLSIHGLDETYPL